jgi:hypothetical protein
MVEEVRIRGEVRLGGPGEGVGFPGPPDATI